MLTNAAYENGTIRPRAKGGRALGAAGLLSLLCIAAACQQDPAGGAHADRSSGTVVQTVTLEAMAIPHLLNAVGTVESPQDTELAAEVEGAVTFLDIPEGREVESGYLLARIDDRQARAALSVAEARYRNAKETFDRLQALHGAAVISRQELDDATTALDEAEGQLDDARTTLGKTAIRAPFAGVVGLRRVSLGAYLSAGDAVVRLTQIKPMHLVFSLPQRAVAQVAIGQTVRGVAGGCTERFTAQVSVIDPSLDPETRMVRIQADLANEKGRLRPGMSATVRVEVRTKPDAVTVPQEAVVRQGTKRIVYTVGDDNTVNASEVKLGEFFTDLVEVTSGLSPGDIVVASGHQKLRPGALVNPEPYQPTDNPNLALGEEVVAGDCTF